MGAMVLQLFTILTIHRKDFYVNVSGFKFLACQNLFLSILATYCTFAPPRSLIVQKFKVNSKASHGVEGLLNDPFYL